jgi:hypothetical protein
MPSCSSGLGFFLFYSFYLVASTAFSCRLFEEQYSCLNKTRVRDNSSAWQRYQWRYSNDMLLLSYLRPLGRSVEGLSFKRSMLNQKSTHMEDYAVRVHARELSIDTNAKSYPTKHVFPKTTSLHPHMRVPARHTLQIPHFRQRSAIHANMVSIAARN